MTDTKAGMVMNLDHLYQERDRKERERIIDSYILNATRIKSVILKGVSEERLKASTSIRSVVLGNIDGANFAQLFKRLYINDDYSIEERPIRLRITNETGSIDVLIELFKRLKDTPLFSRLKTLSLETNDINRDKLEQFLIFLIEQHKGEVLLEKIEFNNCKYPSITPFIKGVDKLTKSITINNQDPGLLTAQEYVELVRSFISNGVEPRYIYIEQDITVGEGSEEYKYFVNTKIGYSAVVPMPI